MKMYSKTIYIVLKNYNAKTKRRQPWYTANYLLLELEKMGNYVKVVNTLKEIKDKKNCIILKFFSFSDLKKPSKKIIENNKFIYIMSFPIIKNFSYVRLKTLINHFKEFNRIILFSIFFKRIFFKFADKQNIEYWCLSDYMQDILNKEHFKTSRLVPFIDDLNTTNNKNISNFFDNKKNIGIGYIGPAYFSRCFDLAIIGLSHLTKKSSKIDPYLLIRNEDKKSEKFTKKLLKKFPIDRLNMNIGFMSRNELNIVMDKIDILIIPFELVMSELPIVCLEGLRLGKTVITTEVSGIHDIFATSNNFRVCTNLDEITDVCYDLIESKNNNKELDDDIFNNIFITNTNLLKSL